MRPWFINVMRCSVMVGVLSRSTLLENVIHNKTFNRYNFVTGRGLKTVLYCDTLAITLGELILKTLGISC
jgi:hypothetical protein